MDTHEYPFLPYVISCNIFSNSDFSHSSYTYLSIEIRVYPSYIIFNSHSSISKLQFFKICNSRTTQQHIAQEQLSTTLLS